MYLLLSDRKPPGVGRGRGRGREDGPGRQTKGIGRGIDDGGRGAGGRGRSGPGGKPGGKGTVFSPFVNLLYSYSLEEAYTICTNVYYIGTSPSVWWPL